MISLSRNCPTALIVGAAGFLGSHLTDRLLSKRVQVIGIDDLSSGKKENLVEANKDKNFHFFNQSIQQGIEIDFPRLDYAFFIVNEELPSYKFQGALEGFLSVCKRYIKNSANPKVVLASSVKLYEEGNSSKNLKEAEVRMAEFAYKNKASARVIRLVAVYGPRMHFREKDPLIELLITAASDEIQKNEVVLDFMSRAIFISDAVELVLKATFHGMTSQKIYDGALIEPVKIEEIKQVLLDPLWHEAQNFQPTRLPPWPTPNLLKTQKELAWKPKTDLVKGLKETLNYLREKKQENRQMIPMRKTEVAEEKILKDPEETEEVRETVIKKKRINLDWGGLKNRAAFYLGLFLISAALIYPVIDLTVGGLSVRYHLKEMAGFIRVGELKKAENEANYAALGVKRLVEAEEFLKMVKASGVMQGDFYNFERLLEVLEDTTEAAGKTVKGEQFLAEGLRRINGESKGSVEEQFLLAQSEFKSAQGLFAESLAKISELNFSGLSAVFQPRVDDLKARIGYYQNLADQVYSFSLVMPKMVGDGGKRSYLLMLQDNRNLRQGGGKLVAYCQLFFETGRLVNSKCGGVEELDKQLSEKVVAPADLKAELGNLEWNLQNSNFDVDFPANAKWAQWFYNKETESLVNGVMVWDLSAVGEILQSTGGLQLPGKYATVSKENLYELSESYKNDSEFLPTVQKELVNKLFFASNKNWFKVGGVLREELKQKHVLVYMSEPILFSQVNLLGWGGVFPRKAIERVGEREEFLAVFENNLTDNLVNEDLQRKYLLESNLDEKGGIGHKLSLSYTKRAMDDYKFNIKLFLTAGTRLKKATFKGVDVTSRFNSLSEYGRSLYSVNLELKEKEGADLIVEYEDLKPLEVKGGEIRLRLNVIKQPGTGKDQFEWKFAHPGSIKTSVENLMAHDLAEDRSFELSLSR